MQRSRTLLPLAAITLTIAMVGSAGMTRASAEDFQAQGSHLNDPANQRGLNDPANARDPADQRGLNDPANKRNLTDQQDPNNSRLNDKSNKRKPQ